MEAKMTEYIRKQDAFDAFEARIAELMTHPEFRRKHLDIDLLGVIRNISAIKPADVVPYSIEPDGTLTVTVPKGTKRISRILIEEDGTQYGGMFYPDTGGCFLSSMERSKHEID